MDTIPATVWFQLISVFVSTMITVATFVWFLGKMKSQFDLQLSSISNEVKLVQNTVHPYGKELDTAKTRIAGLTDRVTRAEAHGSSLARDVKRIEERLDKVQNV